MSKGGLEEAQGPMQVLPGKASSIGTSIIVVTIRSWRHVIGNPRAVWPRCEEYDVLAGLAMHPPRIFIYQLVQGKLFGYMHWATRWFFL
jgi:hypothetical protein